MWVQFSTLSLIASRRAFPWSTSTQILLQAWMLSFDSLRSMNFPTEFLIAQQNRRPNSGRGDGGDEPKLEQHWARLVQDQSQSPFVELETSGVHEICPIRKYQILFFFWFKVECEVASTKESDWNFPTDIVCPVALEPFLENLQRGPQASELPDKTFLIKRGSSHTRGSRKKREFLNAFNFLDKIWDWWYRARRI